MQRRPFQVCGFATWILLATTRAQALAFSNLSNADASSGVKAALEQGALAAVGLLGQSGGFLDNPKVHIPLPGHQHNATKLMKRFGQGRRIE